MSSLRLKAYVISNPAKEAFLLLLSRQYPTADIFTTRLRVVKVILNQLYSPALFSLTLLLASRAVNCLSKNLSELW